EAAAAPAEARARLLLPLGGVVSRVTLWVNGEEREAAFAGRAQARRAYESVAIAQRRDPLLVNTAGPGRVLAQAFPVPSGGGTLKARLGITVPLGLPSADSARLALPRILDANFQVGPDLRHAVLLRSDAAPLADASGL